MMCVTENEMPLFDIFVVNAAASVTRFPFTIDGVIQPSSMAKFSPF
jgi:hypothetical protein